MIWLTWRQFRAAAAMMAAILAVLAVLLALTGPGLADEYAEGIATCVTRPDGCSNFFQDFYHGHQLALLGGTAAMLLLPALIGLFWGAPLITRELEADTHRLVWNQSITRTRWLAVKLVLVGLVSMIAAGLASLAVTWWSGPLDKAAAGNVPGFPRLGPLLFDARGIVPIGYAAFAFALGVAVGMLVRRTLPAMAVTLVVFAVVQIAMPLLVRPHLMTPVRATHPISAANVGDFFTSSGGPISLDVRAAAPNDLGAWVLSSRLVDPSGKPVRGTLPVSTSSGPCAPPERPEEAQKAERTGNPMGACFAELSRLGYRQKLTYHPSSRFWAFQWIETGIFAVLSAGLAGVSFWLIRRRLS